MLANDKPKVLLVKHWIDIHDRGLRLIAARCREAGFEVVYASYDQPDEVVKMAVEEDVDVIGMSFFSSAYEAHLPKVIKGLKKYKLNNVMVVMGGVIPDEDFSWLKKQGVAAIFGPGADLSPFIEMIKEHKTKIAK